MNRLLANRPVVGRLSAMLALATGLKRSCPWAGWAVKLHRRKIISLSPSTQPYIPMANFRTHVTTSSVLGVGYAGVGMAIGMPIESSLLAGGLCGVAGMLPDLDSDSGIPIRESTGFAAALVPMLLIDRFQAMGLPYDQMILLTASIYFFIRFAGASLLGRFSVHRGMFHSIPALFIFSGVAFLLCSGASIEIRYFKAGGVFCGALSHLILDEIYSVEWKNGRWRLKKSSGTALKLWGKRGWANFSVYAKLIVVIVLIAGEPTIMQGLSTRNPQLANQLERIHHFQDSWYTRITGRGVTHDHPEPTRSSPQPSSTPQPATQPQPTTQQPSSTFPESQPSQPWQAAPSPAPLASRPAWQPETWPTSPNVQPPAEGGFRPNSSQQPTQYRTDLGYRTDPNYRAEPVYQAGGYYPPQ